MHTTQATISTKLKVGIFTLLVLLLIGATTVFVNDKPFWWRSCQLVFINIDDATGLKTKSAIRSLGIQIGYLKEFQLYETYVRLGICITAPVEVLPATRAYIRAEGFLGDKFVELKPVKFLGPSIEGGTATKPMDPDFEPPAGETKPAQRPKTSLYRSRILSGTFAVLDRLVPDAKADIERKRPDPEPTPTRPRVSVRGDREIPVGQESKDVQGVVNQVDELVNEMRTLTTNLKQAINPQELRQTMQQLNRTLENASRTLSPEGGLNTTAQRTLAKLEDAIEQLRDQMTRINKGEGSVGMLLNDPKYADEVQEALRNLNRLLNKVSGIRFVVDMGVVGMTAYNSGRGWFRVAIYPRHDRYYLLGISSDPRGSQTVTNTTTVAGNLTTQSQTTQVVTNAMLFTAMIGKIFLERIDVSAGLLWGDGAASAKLNLGPHDREEMLAVRADVYSRFAGIGLDSRVSVQLKPFFKTPILNSLYAIGGIESFRKFGTELPVFGGMGITFDDEDIKLLFALR
jgi:phospholipid/cholesterol/gamma-HCH transport system substrate-binding protein